MFTPATYRCDNCGREETAEGIRGRWMWTTIHFHNQDWERHFCTPECAAPMFTVHLTPQALLRLLDAHLLECCCCGNSVTLRKPDPWEGRMDAYCTVCCEARCDADGVHCA